MSSEHNPHVDSASAAARRAVLVTRVAFVFALLSFAFSVYNALA